MGSLHKKSMLLMLLSFLLMLALVGCSSSQAQEKQPINTGLDPKEWNSYAFKDKFPLHWESFMKNMENEKEVKPKNDPSIEPFLPILWNGFGFAVEYNKTRGHTYALEDQINVRRITDKSIAACLSCKTSLLPDMLEEFGDDFWGMNFKAEAIPYMEKLVAPEAREELGTWGHASIGCSDCHDPVTMELRITRPMLTDALESMGVDVSKATKNDMRSYVCAQCHVEYYFDPLNNKMTTFPWANGLRMEEMYEYYEETIAKDGGFAGEYVSTISNVPILKAQHPEFELSSYGPHGNAGVSCADCHMPYQRVDGKKKISSHRWGSPLNTVEESCRTCHADKSPTYLKDRVEDIQTQHKAALLEAQELSVSAHYYVNRMITRGVDEEKVKQAQEHVRKGQWFWDIIAAENSKGFHNPQGSMDSFRTSSIESMAAITLATEELLKIGEDIEELKRQIEVTKEAVINETVSHEKHTHAINEWFPNVRDQ